MFRPLLPLRWCAAFLAAAWVLAAPPPSVVVVVPVADLFAKATRDCDVTTQALYGSGLIVDEDQGDWLKVRTPEDDYPGWVPRASVAPMDPKAPYAGAGKVLEVQAMAAHLYREPDVTTFAPVLTLPFEVRLEAGEAKDGWFQVRLPDDRRLWIQGGDVMLLDGLRKPALSVQEAIAVGKRFLGTPYTWGGRSSFGYDCSGLCQMLMRLQGHFMPRDAGPQAAWDRFAPVDRRHLKAGDLLYFGDGKEITHTGMYIGQGLFLHATTNTHPVLQISRLKDPPWPRILMAQRRYKP